MINILLSHDALIDYPDDGGFTALHRAIFFGHPATVYELLIARANRAARNNAGNTPLEVCKPNPSEILFYFVDNHSHSYVLVSAGVQKPGPL